MGHGFWIQAGLLPAVFAVLAVFRAATSAGAPWRARLKRLAVDLGWSLAWLALLAALVLVLHLMGIGNGPAAGCQPSPNGAICSDE